MIKYRCPHCSQKLGVPDEYAGHRVRCTKCSQRSIVPQKNVPVAKPVTDVSVSVPVAIVAKPVPKAQASQRPSSESVSAATEGAPQPSVSPVATASGSDIQSDSDLKPQQNQPVKSVPDIPELVPEDEFPEVIEEDPNTAILRQLRDSQARKINLKIPSRHKLPGRHDGKTKKTRPQKEEGGGFSLGDYIPDAFRMPLAFLLAFGTVGGLILTWIVMARAQDSTMSFFAALIPLAGAVSLRLMPNRGTAVGFLAVFLGFAGVGAGKVAMAKYGMVPMLQKQAEEEVLENIEVTLNNKDLQLKPNESAKKSVLNRPGALPCLAIAHLVHKENADPHKARLLAMDILESGGGGQGFNEFISNLGANDASAEFRDAALYERLESNELYGRVQSVMWGWDEKSAIRMARTYYPAYARLARQAQVRRQLSGQTDLFKYCFMQSFGAMDFIWIALGIGGAFIVSTID